MCGFLPPAGALGLWPTVQFLPEGLLFRVQDSGFRVYGLRFSFYLNV